MNPILAFLVLAASILGGMHLKNNVARFAGWNLFILIVLVYVSAIFAVMLCAFVMAMVR